MAERTPSRSGGGDRSRSPRAPAGGARPASARPASARPAPARAGSVRTGPARGSKSGGRPGPGKERPALAARPRTRPPEPPSQSTTWVRGAILLGILVMLAVTLVPTLRSVVQQRNDTVALQDKLARQRLAVAEIEKQAALWKDPTYIEEQARARLKFVRVGDRAYTVVDADKESKAQPDAEPVVAAPMANDFSPWYGKVWQSIQIADRPTAGLAP